MASRPTGRLRDRVSHAGVVSDHAYPVPFGTLRTVLVSLAGLVLVGSLLLQLLVREILWGPMLTAVGMVFVAGGQVAAWRSERRRGQAPDSG